MSNAKIRHRRRRRAKISAETNRHQAWTAVIEAVQKEGGFDVCYNAFLTGAYLPVQVRAFIKLYTFGDRMMRPMSKIVTR